jgi:hypothetical protein
MATKIIAGPPLVRASTQEFADGYEKGRAFFLTGQLLHEPDNIPDESYLINNLVCLHEDGAFSDTGLLCWHIGFLMGVVEAGGRA